MRKEFKTGFALSGGFIKGFAHFGVMQALLEHDIRPDIIAGVSAGALAGVFLADGQEPRAALERFEKQPFFHFTRPTLSRAGVLRLDELMEFLRGNLTARRIEDLKIPFIASSTDFDHARIVHFRQGEIAPRIAASCCVPVLFKPVMINGVNYVDGGILMNLPVSPIRNRCRRVIAVNVNRFTDESYKNNMASIATRTYHFLMHANILPEAALCDLLIEPEGLWDYSNTDLDKASEIFERGYRAALDALAVGRRVPAGVRKGNCAPSTTR